MSAAGSRYEPGGDPPAARITRAEIEVAAERADPFPHPGQAAARGAGQGAAPGAVVLDVHLYLGGCELQPDGCACAWTGMFHGVRQGLLHEPEDRKLDTGRQVGACAAALVVHRQAGRPDPAEQIVQVGQARQRLPRFLPGIGSEHAEQAGGSRRAPAGQCRHVTDRIGRLARARG